MLKQAQKVVLAITSVVLTVTGLGAALVHSHFRDDLLTLTTAALLLAVLIPLGYQIFRGWRDPMQQVQSYLQARYIDGDRLMLEFKDPGCPLALLTAQINQLLVQPKPQEETFLIALLAHWPTPTALFHKLNGLRFFNHALHQQVKKPLLLGMSLKSAGFDWQHNRVTHPDFDHHWQSNVVQLPDSQHMIISANFIGEQLQAARLASQADIVRILSHELKNSLTPMSSMADTLLEYPLLPESETRQALTRIRQRSDRLLSFIHAYAQLNQLPEPTPCHFNFITLAEQNAKEHQLQLEFHGQTQCFADPILMEQVVINVFRNAQQASGDNTDISIHSFIDGSHQVIIITDNGPGFANLTNALTPLYTTKKEGNGLGLALCHEIIERHGGQLQLSNTETGASVNIRLPLGQNSASINAKSYTQ